MPVPGRNGPRCRRGRAFIRYGARSLVARQRATVQRRIGEEKINACPDREEERERGRGRTRERGRAKASVIVFLLDPAVGENFDRV